MQEEEGDLGGGLWENEGSEQDGDETRRRDSLIHSVTTREKFLANP